MTDLNNVDVLLVEDDPNDVELILRALGRHNLADKVFVAIDGEEALDFVFARGKYSSRSKNIMPKVIFLDIKLPKVNGLEVLKALKSDPVAKLIPVVAVSSSREENDVVRSYELGVNSYIVKPVDFKEFIDSLDEAGFYWLLLNQPPNKK